MQIEAANAENALTNYLMAGVMAVFAAIITWYFKIPLNPRAPNALPLVLIPGAITVIGVGYLLSALLGSMRISRIGTSTLDADEVAVLGRRFTGVISSSKPLNFNTTYKVQLCCIETRSEWNPNRNGRQYHQTTLWKGSCDARPEPDRPSGGIRVSFDIPSNCPATTHPESGPVQEGVRWVLEARVRGLWRYYSLFQLNVHSAPLPPGAEEQRAT